MFIQSIQLINFRSVVSLETTLDERMNVFVGMNGVGKSTILDATAILLSWFANRIKTAGASGRQIKVSDIQNGAPHAALSAVLNDSSETLDWGVYKSRSGHSKKGISVGLSELSEKAKQIQGKITDSDGQTNLPLLAYYPVNRAVLDIPLRIRKKHTFEPIDAYEESLAGGVSFRIFFEWFRQQEDIENENNATGPEVDWFEKRLKAGGRLGVALVKILLGNKGSCVNLEESIDTEASTTNLFESKQLSLDELKAKLIAEMQLTPELFEAEQLEKEELTARLHDLVAPKNEERQLAAVRRALSVFMPGFSNLRVRRNPLRMEVTKNGQVVIVNQLSDGEKCLMALVGDIARRMAIANPALDNPLHGDGIVLIDEIDLHLHPLWQRMMVPRLLETFPNCQFLISTHSPHVLTHVQPQNIFILRSEGGKFSCEHPQESYGKTSERIFEDLMGMETTRPTKVTESLKTLFVRIHNGELDQAKKDIESLQQEIGEDPDLVKARVLIKRKELIGK